MESDSYAAYLQHPDDTQHPDHNTQNTDNNLEHAITLDDIDSNDEQPKGENVSSDLPPSTTEPGPSQSQSQPHPYVQPNSFLPFPISNPYLHHAYFLTPPHHNPYSPTGGTGHLHPPTINKNPPHFQLVAPVPPTPSYDMGEVSESPSINYILFIHPSYPIVHQRRRTILSTCETAPAAVTPTTRANQTLPTALYANQRTYAPCRRTSTFRNWG